MLVGTSKSRTWSGAFCPNHGGGPCRRPLQAAPGAAGIASSLFSSLFVLQKRDPSVRPFLQHKEGRKEASGETRSRGSRGASRSTTTMAGLEAKGNAPTAHLTRCVQRYEQIRAHHATARGRGGGGSKMCLNTNAAMMPRCSCQISSLRYC